MNHPIGDALTGAEARACVAALLLAIDKHDASRDTRTLHADLLAVTELAEGLAHGVPDDGAWPNYGQIWDTVAA